MKLRSLALLTLVFALVGCYHVTVETGAPASGNVVEQPWALAFVGGLIPPPTVDVASECPNGVSRVESQLSFLNLVVAALTSSIITPMTITVTCASGGMEEAADGAIEVIDAESADPDDLARALTDAAMRSWHTMGSPVYVSMPMR